MFFLSTKNCCLEMTSNVLMSFYSNFWRELKGNKDGICRKMFLLWWRGGVLQLFECLNNGWVLHFFNPPFNPLLASSDLCDRDCELCAEFEPFYSTKFTISLWFNSSSMLPGIYIYTKSWGLKSIWSYLNLIIQCKLNVFEIWKMTFCTLHCLSQFYYKAEGHFLSNI